MPKFAKHLILKALVAALFTGLLVISVLFYKNPEPSEAALSEEFGAVTCDEFIPIGTALDGVLGMLDQAFEVYQGENMALAMNNIMGVMSALTEHPNICDFRKCVAQVDNQGPELGVEFDAFFWKGELTFEIPPWCAPQEGIDEPCPDVSQFLEENDQNIMGLRTLKNSFMVSAEMLHDIFEKKTEPLPADLVRYKEDADGNLLQDGDGNPIPDIEPGEKITKADLWLRAVEKVDVQLTPGNYKSCALTSLQRKLVADGKMGDIYPMQCKRAREQGLYWPRQWSEKCVNECDGGSEEDCIECLSQSPGDDATTLAEINYKIYKTCEDECGPIDPETTEREWAMSKECEKCLCTKPVKAVAGSGGIPGGVTEQLSEEACIAWLCGGSASNWVCCHQTVLEDLPERPEW